MGSVTMARPGLYPSTMPRRSSAGSTALVEPDPAMTLMPTPITSARSRSDRSLTLGPSGSAMTPTRSSGSPIAMGRRDAPRRPVGTGGSGSRDAWAARGCLVAAGRSAGASTKAGVPPNISASRASVRTCASSSSASSILSRGRKNPGTFAIAPIPRARAVGDLSRSRPEPSDLGSIPTVIGSVSCPAGPIETRQKYRCGRAPPEKGQEVFLTPRDRTAQLTMRNLDVADTREKIRVYHEVGLMGTTPHEGLPRLPAAGPEAGPSGDAVGQRWAKQTAVGYDSTATTGQRRTPPQTRRRESLMALWRLAVTGEPLRASGTFRGTAEPRPRRSGFRSSGRRRSGPQVQVPGAR